jgi:hypothetical protein
MLWAAAQPRSPARSPAAVFGNRSRNARPVRTTDAASPGAAVVRARSQVAGACQEFCVWRRCSLEG